MKKILIILLIMMNLTTANAQNNIPKYQITAASNSQSDIDAMYDTKDQLIRDYKKWVKGVDDVYQVLKDHEDCYNAKYQNGTYIIVLGNGQGRKISGKLQVSYCTSSKEIKKKSLFASLFS